MDYIRESWYAAGWSDEVTRDLLPRHFLEEPVVLYRRENGEPVALADQCPHRFVPLSRGSLVGDNIECIYHGLQFDCNGLCALNPHGKGVVPRAAKVRSYPLAERHGLVWIWMGTPEHADPTIIPDFHWITDTEHYAMARGTLLLNANYLLVMDNLTDLSHAAFLHPGLESRDLARAAFAVTQEGDEVWVKQFVPAMPCPGYMTAMKGFTGPYDHWLEMRFVPPCNMTTFAAVSEPGQPRESGWGTYNPNIITPATATTTHYFWGAGRDFDIDDSVVTERFHMAAKTAFTYEDKVMLELQQTALGKDDLMDRKPVLLTNDAGSARARRVVARLLAQERREPTSAITN